MRDRLIELLTNMYLPINVRNRLGSYDTVGERRLGEFEINGIADHLLANGVIVPPCKVGDKVFFIVDMSGHSAFNDFVTDDTVTKIGVTTKGLLYEKGFNFADFGKTVFLTKEEAEKALAEREGKE